MNLAPRASVSKQDIDAFRRHPPSMPIIDETATKALPALLSAHLPQIMSIIDLAEPFYLPVEGHWPEDTRADSSLITRASHPGAMYSMHEHIASERSLDEVALRGMNHFEHAWGDLF